MSRKAWRLYLAGGVVAVALYFLLPLQGLWSSLAYDLIGLSSVAVILVGVRRHRPAPAGDLVVLCGRPAPVRRR
jgi:hypothetical protein